MRASPATGTHGSKNRSLHIGRKRSEQPVASAARFRPSVLCAARLTGRPDKAAPQPTEDGGPDAAFGRDGRRWMKDGGGEMEDRRALRARQGEVRKSSPGTSNTFKT